MGAEPHGGDSHRGKRHPSTDIVVFSILRDSACAECGMELWRGEFLTMAAGQPRCLDCADLDHLVYLPSGDAALTRRASRYSALRAVVVRFSRSRRRYERQGVLVDEPALVRAEQECLADEDVRRFARERAADRRQQLDAEYIRVFATRIGEIFPGCPPEEQLAIAEHACLKHSGRVGRSAAAKALDEDAVELAVRAHVRHVHSRYDTLLMKGMERDEARASIADVVTSRMDRWRAGRR
jgi:hypothetical protein